MADTGDREEAPDGIAAECARILDATDVVGDSAADTARLAALQARWGSASTAGDDAPALLADMQWLLAHIGADLASDVIAPARTMDPGFAEFRDDMCRVSLDWETGSDLYILVTEGLEPGWYTMGYSRSLQWGNDWERGYFASENERRGEGRFSEYDQPSARTLEAVIDACVDFDWAPLVIWTEDAVAELRARDGVDAAVIDRLQAEAAAGRERLTAALRADLAWRRQDLARRVHWIRARFPGLG